MLDKVKQVLENQNARENITAMGSEATMRLDEATEMLDAVENSTSQNFADFMNNHPNLTSLIIWVVMILNTIGALGSVVGKQDTDADMDQVVKQIIREIQEETDSTDNMQPDPENTNQVPAAGGKNKTKKETPYPNAVEVRTINPKDEKLLNERGSYVLQLLPNFETYKKRNADGTFGTNPGESRCTIGYGNTWEDIRVGNTVYRYPCSNKYLPETAALVKEIKENYEKDNRQYFIERAKLHMLVETLPTLRKALKDNGMPAPEDLPNHQLAALLLAGYQMRVDIISNVQRLAKAKTEEAKINAFSWTWASKGNLDGTFARKYWLALLYTNKITREDLLTFPIDKFNKINRPNGTKNTSSYIVKGSRQDIKRSDGIIHGCKFKITKQDIEKNKKIVKSENSTETLAQHLDKHGLKNSSKTKTKEQTVAKQDSEHKQSEKSVVTKIAEKIKDATTGIITIDSKMKTAKDAYDNGNYGDAITLYKNVIAEDADNLEAYSSLGLVYKKLGDKTSGNTAIANYEESCKVIGQGLNRMNQNRALASDFEHKASLYYNAGLSREALADVYHRKNNIHKAKEEYNKARINYNNAYEAIKGKDNKKANEYKLARDKSEQKLNSLKKTAFNAASKMMRNLILPGENRDASKFFETDVGRI